jgi:DNA-binding transcriptional ArsR family regulator
MNKRADNLNTHSIAFLAKCLADENRLRILLCVSKEKKSVSRIVEELGLSQPLISHHLKELKRALLVKVERSGPFVYHEMTDQRILIILAGLDELGAALLSDRITF